MTLAQKFVLWIIGITVFLGIVWVAIDKWQDGKPMREVARIEAEKALTVHAEKVRKNTPPKEETLIIDSTTIPAILKDRHGRQIKQIWHNRCVLAYWEKGPSGPWPLRKRCGIGNIWELYPNARGEIVLDTDNYMKATKIGFLHPPLGWFEKVRPFEITVEYK